MRIAFALLLALCRRGRRQRLPAVGLAIAERIPPGVTPVTSVPRTSFKPLVPSPTIEIPPPID